MRRTSVALLLLALMALAAALAPRWQAPVYEIVFSAEPCDVHGACRD